jgi:hypothetical protein
VAENFLYSFRLSSAGIYSVDRTDTRKYRSISITQALTLQLSGTAMMLQQRHRLLQLFVRNNYMAVTELCNAEKSSSIIRSIYQPT